MKDPISRTVRSHLALIRSRAISGLRGAAHGPARAKVAMFHVGRSGSTVLARMLSRHSQVRWGNELFFDVESRAPAFRPTQAWVRSVITFAANEYRIPYFGFETKATQFGPHCISMSVEEYISLLQRLGFHHFVVLTRNNLLRVVVSGMVGTRSGEWHKVSGPSEPTPITVDPDQPWGSWAGSLTEILEYYESFYGTFDALLADARRLDLNYEADIEHDPAVGYRKICSFLGIAPEQQPIPLERTNPFSIQDMVLNFAEVSRALQGTRFEWMLTA